MRGIIHDQASHKFIEGPIQSKPVDDNLQAGNDEKAAHNIDFAQGYEVLEKKHDQGIDIYQLFDENERYD